MELSYAIIKVLKKYSSAEKTECTSPLKQREIFEYLIKEFPNLRGEITSKKVRTSLEAVINQELSLDDKYKTIRYTVYMRGDNEYKTNFWIPNTISDIELKFLIDCVMYSSIFNSHSAQDLASRIQGLSGKNLRNLTPYANNSFGRQRFTLSTDVLNNVEKIMFANGRQIIFDWNVYGVVNGKVDIIKVEKYNVNPIDIILNNGRYFLLARYEGSAKIYTFSVDLMTNIEITDCKSNDGIKLSDFEYNFLRALYVLQHPYMMGGESIEFKIRVNKKYFSRVVNDFSYEIKIISSTETDTTIDISVKASEKAMLYWLLHNYDIAEALNMNEDFEADIQKAVKFLYKKYIKNA